MTDEINRVSIYFSSPQTTKALIRMVGLLQDGGLSSSNDHYSDLSPPLARMFKRITVQISPTGDRLSELQPQAISRVVPKEQRELFQSLQPEGAMEAAHDLRSILFLPPKS